MGYPPPPSKWEAAGPGQFSRAIGALCHGHSHGGGAFSRRGPNPGDSKKGPAACLSGCNMWAQDQGGRGEQAQASSWSQVLPWGPILQGGHSSDSTARTRGGAGAQGRVHPRELRRWWPSVGPETGCCCVLSGAVRGGTGGRGSWLLLGEVTQTVTLREQQKTRRGKSLCPYPAIRSEGQQLEACHQESHTDTQETHRDASQRSHTDTSTETPDRTPQRSQREDTQTAPRDL